LIAFGPFIGKLGLLKRSKENLIEGYEGKYVAMK